MIQKTRKILLFPNELGNFQPVQFEMQAEDMFKQIRMKCWDHFKIDAHVCILRCNNQLPRDLEQLIKYFKSSNEECRIDVYSIENLLKGSSKIAYVDKPEQNSDQSRILKDEINLLKQRFTQEQQNSQVERDQFESERRASKQKLEDQKQLIEQNEALQQKLRFQSVEKYKELQQQLLQQRRSNQDKEQEIEQLKQNLMDLKAELKFTKSDYERSKLQVVPSNSKSEDSSIYIQEISSLRSQLQGLDFTIQKLKENINTLSQLKTEQDHKISIKDADLQNLRVQSEYELTEKNSIIDSLQQKLTHKEQVIKQNEAEIQQLRNQLSSMTAQNVMNSNMLQNYKEENQDLKNQLENKQQEIITKQQQITNLKLNQDKKEDEITKNKGEFMEQNEMLRNQLTKMKQEQQKLELHFQNLQQEKDNVENRANQLEAKLKEAIEHNQKLQQTSEKMVDEEKSKFAALLQKKARIAQVCRILQNKGPDRKCISPTEAFYRTYEDPRQYFKDVNAQTNEVIFQVQQIVIINNQLDQLIGQLSDLNISKSYNLQEIGQITCTKSIQPNGEGTKKRLYVALALDTNFKDQVFALKEFNNSEIKSVQDAEPLFAPALITKFLMEKYLDKLGKSHSSKLPAQFTLQEQYIFYNDGKYYVGELLNTGKFIKFNGQGESANKDTQQTQLINAFSLFTHVYSKNQLMVSNLQAVGTVVYDPIVNTEDGLFNQEDLGNDEIISMTTNYKSDRKFYGESFIKSLNMKI